MLPEAASREIYEAWHPSVENNVSTTDTPWAALVLQHLKPGELDDRSVLEIGCGRGELVRRLVGAMRGPRHLVAADFAQSAVQSGRRRTHETHGHRVSWAVGSIQDIPVADATFDTVISCETIEHVVEPMKAMKELHRVLRPGGRLLLTTPITWARWDCIVAT